MLVEFVELYRSTTGHSIVEPAHMEIAEPTIPQAIGVLLTADDVPGVLFSIAD
jgi:hypothetical protein